MKTHPLMAGILAIFVLSGYVLGQEDGWIDVGTVVRLTTSTDKVGIGTSAPKQKLHIEGGIDASLSDGSGYLIIGNQNSTNLVWDNNELMARNNEGESTLYFQSDGGDLNVHYNQAGGTEFVIKDNGKVGIGTASPYRKLEVAGEVRYKNALEGHNTTNSSACYLKFEPSFQSVSNVWRFRVGGTPTAGGFALGFFDGMPNLWLKSDGKVGIGTTSPQAKLDVNGTTRTKVIEITGGSDLAEPFEVASTESINPGMVVSIDPEQPGQLRVSSQAYDRTVAGIISGAGGMNPGILMTQAEPEADATYPVALSGRVYAWADASKGPIQPGDLLTTSNTPGYAMKVSDYTKAQGTIIGKAMSSLEEGRDLVLVLVALQ